MKRMAGIAATALLAAAVACNKPAAQPAANAAPAGPAPGSTEWKIESAMSAAPAGISAHATIMDYPASDTGQMVQLRAGTNGWTCVPDYPASPGPDPTCADSTWMKWFASWMQHKPPVVTSVGIAYMLMGAADASNTDPFKMKPDSGQSWVTTGPHLMIIQPSSHAYDATSNTPSNDGPYVMFKGTPYAMLMVPVGGEEHAMH